MSQLVVYAPKEVPLVWGAVEPLIQKALDRGSIYTIDDIYSGLLRSEMQLWAALDGGIEAALVTSIQVKDGTTFCLLLALGGTGLKNWSKWQPDLEAWAKSEGCAEMRIYGRIGWAKIVNYDIVYTKMRKKL